jgi:hypothetical protein
MTTVIDIIVLLLAYAGLSLTCAGLIWLLRRRPQSHRYEGPTTSAWCSGGTAAFVKTHSPWPNYSSG